MYSATVLALFQNPHRQGILEPADAVGHAGVSGQGPYMAVSLRVAEGCILEASFDTYGCPAAVACGSFVTHWVEGKTFEQALLISGEDLQKILGGLPLGKEHTAHLAVNALRDALRQCAPTGGV